MIPEEIQARINSTGEIEDADIEEVLSFYEDEENNYIYLQVFLEGVTCISEDEKLRILGNIESYAI